MTVTTIAGSLLGYSVLSPAAQAYAESIGAEKLPAALHVVLDGAPAQAQAIIDDANLSAKGRTVALADARTKLTTGIIDAVKGPAGRTAMALHVNRRTLPGNGDQVSRREYMAFAGISAATQAFTLSEIQGNLERWRDYAQTAHAEAGALQGALAKAAAQGDLAPFFALDSMISPARQRVIDQTLLTEEQLAALRSQVREQLDPKNAATRDTLAEVGSWIYSLAAGARGVLERTKIGASPAATVQLRAALEELESELILVGARTPRTPDAAT